MAARACAKCAARTGVLVEMTGSTQTTAGRPAVARGAVIAARSSIMWIALIGVAVVAG